MTLRSRAQLLCRPPCRPQTAFVSDLNKTESSVPVLNEYVLTAGDTVKRWNTLVDWNAGTFAGAAGHQSADVYINHAKDFDDYSGTADAPDAVTFTDIATHWAKSSIDYVVKNNLFNGTSATTFSPDAGMTRAMFVTVLGRQAKVDTTSYKDSAFSDVAAGEYYAPYVAWAAKNGIVTGATATAFEPNAVVTREQMAALLYRYAQLQKYDTTQGGMAIREFTDYDHISSYALPALGWAVNSGLMQGSAGKLTPSATATRAEVAATLQRFAQKFIG